MAKRTIHRERIHVRVGAKSRVPQPDASRTPTRSGAYWLWGLIGIAFFVGLVLVSVGSLYRSRPQQPAQQIAQVMPPTATSTPIPRLAQQSAQQVTHMMPLTATPAPTPQQASNCIQPLDGLVSWWPGDGNADDIVGVNPGTLQGKTTFIPGKVGQAFSFAAPGDMVQIADNPNLNLESLTGSTFEGWFKSMAETSGETLVIAKHTCGKGAGWFFSTDQGCFTGNHYIGGSGVGRLNLDDGQFHHFACMKDGTTYREYIDGTLISEDTGPAMGASVAEPVQIGDLSTGTCFPSHFGQFGRLVDDIKVYSRPLDSSEIQAIYNAGSAGMCKPENHTEKATHTTEATNKSTTIPTSEGCISPPTSLVSWWPGDGNADDIVGENNGKLVSGVDFTDGMVGQAFRFDGSNGIVIATATNLPKGAAQRTVAFWAKTDPKAINATGFSYSSEAIGQGFYVFTTNQENSGRLTFSGHGTAFNVFTPDDLRDDQYHHVAVTYDGSTATVYADGVAIGSNNFNLNTGISGGACIGGRCPLNSFLTGEVDEVAVWDRVLSASEIEAMFKAGSAGMCKSGAATRRAQQPAQQVAQVVQPTATNTLAPSATATFTSVPPIATPIPPPTATPMTDTPPGTILEGGQTWRQGGAEITVQNVELTTDQIHFDLAFTNHKPQDIFVKYSLDSYTVIDNLGRRSQVPGSEIGYNCGGFRWNIENTIAVPRDATVKLSPCQNIYALVDVGNPNVTEIIITISGVSSISKARWRIPIYH